MLTETLATSKGNSTVSQENSVNSTKNKEDPKMKGNESENDDKLVVHAQKYPHLKKIFNKIDDFLKEITENPKLTVGRYKNSYAISDLMFMGYKYHDKVVIGEYFSLTDAADLIRNSYEMLLKELGISCLACLPVEEIENGGEAIQKLIALRDVICSNIARNPFAMNSCRSGMMNHFVEDLKVLKVEEVTGKDGEPVEIFDSVIITLHNCARYQPARKLLREYGTVRHLLDFLECESKSMKVFVLMTLSKLVDETENKYILADESVFEVIFEIFEVAWKNSDHFGHRWTVSTLMNGLADLAKNDSNKIVLYEKGVVPVLMKVMKDGWKHEQEDAARCIWELAFDKTIKLELAKNDELLRILDELKSSPEQSIRQVAKGAIWEIQQFERVQTPSSESAGDGQDLQKGHVMISYQWADQSMLRKIKDSLASAGYSVWMDIDNIKESTLEAMAQAVEDAAVVLVCMSEKYKLSQNCRSEAEYAFTLKKRIVPLIMQEKYIPDGWLGIIKGAKLFFDFSGKYQYEDVLGRLLKELGEDGKQQLTTDSNERKNANSEKPKGPKQTKGHHPVSSWSQKDVQNWLTKIGLQNKPSLKSLSVECLLFLQELRQNAGAYYYSYVETKLGLDSMEEMAAFCRAMKEL